MQAGSGINFLVMSEQNKYGLAFERALRDSEEWKPKTLADEMNVNPQRITHWKKRGVSARYAMAVADLLQVDVSEISKVESSANQYVVAEMVADWGAPKTVVLASQDDIVDEALTSSKEMAAVAAIADQASAEDAIMFAEYFLARARAALREK